MPLGSIVEGIREENNVKNLVLFVALMIFGDTSLAMQCIRESVEKYYKIADFVFEATVVERTKIADQGNGICWSEGEICGPKIAGVKVERTWKGTFPSGNTSIYSEDGCYCLGTYFNVGEKYLVFGKKSSQKEFEVLDMGACATELIANVEPKPLKKLDKLSERDK